MNYLQLVNRARRECGAASTDLTTLQSSLVLDDKRFADWVNEAWRDIQTRKPDWDWMLENFVFSTTPGQATYSPSAANLSDHASWKRDSLRVFAGSTVDEQFLSYVEYPRFRNLYEFGQQRTAQGRPIVFSIDPKKGLRLAPVPDSTGYQVDGQYWRQARDLVSDADSPDMPVQYHMLVVWQACLAYGQFESAPEVIQRATAEAGKLMGRLQLDEMPELQAGAPLA